MSGLSGHLDEWEDAAKSFPAIDDMGELRARTARLAGFVRRLVPAVREQDAEIARLREALRLTDAMREENLGLAAAAIHRADRAEATIARVNALIEVWKARRYAMYEGCADELTWALIRPDDQPKGT
jgi:hypothetical protein